MLMTKDVKDHAFKSKMLVELSKKWPNVFAEFLKPSLPSSLWKRETWGAKEELDPCLDFCAQSCMCDGK